MIELDRHIEILLLSNDCVIVPDLGGFMAHHIDARYDEADGIFLPPLRTLGFNPQLKMNDSLLVQSYVETYDLSYPDALRRIEGEVEELRQHLETNGHFELNGLGVLSFNEEGHLEFEPCEAGILTPSLYGLSSFDLKPLAVELPVEPEIVDEEIAEEEPADTAITIRMSWLRNVVAVAAAVIAFFMIGKPISNSDVQQSAFIHIGSTTAEKPVSHDTTLKEQTPVSEESAIEEIISEDIPSPVQTDSYCIVLASQVSKRNATNFVNQLQEAGFKDARMMEGKMIRVVYGTYQSETDAYNDIRTLRSQSRHFREAWVLKIEN